MTQRQLIESTAIDIIAAIREHGPTRDVIVPRLEKLIGKLQDEITELQSNLNYCKYILGRKQPLGGSFVDGKPPR